MAKAETKTKPMSARMLAVFAVPFAIAGLGFGGCGAWTAAQYQRAKGWVETPATIRSAEIKTHRGKSNNTYETTAVYEYEYRERRYIGNRVSLHFGRDSPGSYHHDIHRELSRHQQTGEPFSAYVNPHNPTESVLDRQVRWPNMLLFGGMAALFGSGGIGLAWEALNLRRRELAVAAQPQSTSQPWQSRADWAAGRVHPSADTNPTPAIILAAWWVVAGLPLVITLPGMLAGATSRWVWLTLIPPVIAAMLVVSAVYLVFRRRKFGAAVLELESVPEVVGGALAGVVRVPTRVASEDGFRAKLICMRQFETERRKEHEESIWQDERHVPPGEVRTKQGNTSVPVRFIIPASARPTSLPGETTTIRWLLELSSRLPGIDFKTEFEVPVFQTADSAKIDPPSVPADEPKSPRDLERFYREAGIQRIKLPAGGVRFVFGMFRNPVSALVTTLIAVALISVTWLLIKAGALFIFPLVIGLLAFCFTLTAISLWLDRSVVEASPASLVVRGGWLGLGKKREFPSTEIKQFTLKQTMASGKNVWNTIYFEPRTGKRRKIAPSIGSRLVEQHVIEELNRAIGH